jgi:large subunit ribosomal protein L3
MLGLLGRKLGMAQIFGADGQAIPVTVLEVGPCTVVQRKSAAGEGYDALQLGFGSTKPKRMSQPQRGHFTKRGLGLFKHLGEFRTEQAGKFEIGEVLCVAGFEAGEKVNVRGVSKGRGFQGVIKRWGKHGGPAAHGSDFHRRPGSIGMRTWPGRIFKNTKLPGHMGCNAVTVRNLKVMEVRPDENILLVKGAIPGPRNGFVVVTPAAGELESRANLKRAKAEAEEAKPSAEPGIEETKQEKQAEQTKE